MAQNISVTLTLDDKQYTTKLKAVETATKSFSKNAETSALAANNAFTKLSNGTDLMVRRFGGLRSAIAGLGFAAMGSSALAMADNLQDLSNATGIAVGRLLELKKALTTSGGDAEQMGTALNNFLRSVDDAAEGSIKAQNSFMGLKVSMEDLRTLSEQDLFIKTLEGIAAIESPTRRAQEMMDKFGKSFKTVDPQELLDKLKATRGEGDMYAATIKRAAELNDQLATAQGNLKLAFLEAFSGPMQSLIQFNAHTADGTAKMEGLISAIKVLGIVLATSFAVSGALALVGLIGQIGRGITVVLGVSKGLGGVFRGGGTFMVGLRGVAVLIATIGTSIFAASQLFDNFGDIAYNALSRIAEAVVSLAGSLGGAGLGAALGSFLGPIGTLVGGIAGGFAGDALGKALGADDLVAKMKASREERERIAQLDKLHKNRTAVASEGVAVATGTGVKGGGMDTTAGREVDQTARRNAIQSVRDINIEFEKQQRLKLGALATETHLVGKTEEHKQLYQAQTELALAYQQTQEQLIQRRNTLGKEEQYLAGEINATIKKNSEVYAKQQEDLVKGVTAQQTANLLEKDRLNTLENITKAIDNQVAKQEALAELLRSANEQKFAAKDNIPASQLVGLSSIQKQIVDIQENARKAANEAAKAFAEKFGEINTTADAQEFADGLDKIATAWKGVAGAQTEVAKTNYDISRSFSTGWTDAFAKYAEDAQNAAEQAATYFDRFTKGFEDAVVALVTNGKFSFKDFANSIIADFARIEARKALTSVMSGATPGGSVLGSLFNFGKSLFGFANGGTIGAGMPAIVGERGPELFMPSNAGKIIPNNQLGGQSQVVHTTVNYAIQAVDASSFRSLVARDPSFIYAVTEQGRRSQPTRRSA
jgi:lambda family phage tail tape measure protein